MAFPTWSTTDKSASITLTNGNLTAAVSSGGNASVRSSVGATDNKRYIEITVTGTLAASDGGFRTAASSLSAHVDVYVQLTDGGVWRSGSFQGYSISGNASFVSGDVLGMAINFTALRVWFRRNSGVWNAGGGADPATNVGGLDVSALFTGVAALPSVFLNTTALNFTANFGASAFVGAAPSGFSPWWEEPAVPPASNYAGGSGYGRGRMIRKRKKGELDDLDPDDLYPNTNQIIRIGRQAYGD